MSRIFESKEVGSISSKRNFIEADRILADDKKRLLYARQQEREWQKQIEILEKKIEEDEQNKVDNGILYYTENRRADLIEQGEKLRFSPKAIERMRFEKDQWNQDNIDSDIISDFEALERFVEKNTPAWKNTIVAKLGKVMNGNK